MNKELEYAKCCLHDNSFEIDHLNEYCFRAKKGDVYFYDVYTKSKKGHFLHYTVFDWRTKKWTTLNEKQIEHLKI